MALTSIFTGMEKGPEEIDKNFKIVENYIDEAETILNYTKEGVVGESNIYIKRKGKLVTLYGTMGITSSSSGRTTLFKIPEGYTPITSSAVGGAWPSNTYAGQVCYFYYNANGLQMMPGPGFSFPSNNGINTITGSFTYFTNDDFPTE